MLSLMQAVFQGKGPACGKHSNPPPPLEEGWQGTALKAQNGHVLVAVGAVFLWWRPPRAFAGRRHPLGCIETRAFHSVFRAPIPPSRRPVPGSTRPSQGQPPRGPSSGTFRSARPTAVSLLIPPHPPGQRGSRQTTPRPGPPPIAGTPSCTSLSSSAC